MIRLRVALACFILISVAAALCLAPAEKAHASPRSGELPNMAFISIDSLRQDRLSCYGYSRATSPFIDTIAGEGVLFSQAITTATWTTASYASVLTGIYPSAHGVRVREESIWSAVPTLAELLSAKGYATGAFVVGPMMRGYYGFSRGFDVYDDYTLELRAERILPSSGGFQHTPYTLTSPVLTRQAIEWLSKRGSERPFFLFMHFWDVHFPYLPPLTYRKQFEGKPPPESWGAASEAEREILNAYDSCIRYVDDHISKVVKKLQEVSGDRQLLIAVFADHGEEFEAHGFGGHGANLYDTTLLVPLVVKGPGFPPGARCARQASLVDLMPTALELAGVKAPPGLGGESLLSVMKGNPEDRASYANLHDIVECVRTTKWKFIATEGAGRYELYDLEKDPAEKQNLFSARPDVAEAMRATLRKFQEQVRATGEAYRATSPNNTLVFDQETIKKLRALGYAK